MSDEHPEVSALIEAAKGGGDAAAAAAARLAEIGMPALGAIVEAIRQSPLPSSALRNALLRMRGPELTDALIELLNDSNAFLPGLAAEALGSSGEPRALRPLLDLYKDEIKSESARGSAALALGRLGDERAVPELLKTAQDLAGGGRFEEHAALICSAAIALARFGNQGAAEIVASMALSPDPGVADEAAFALRHLIGRGLFPALQKARRSEMTEARQEALAALYYLGLRECMEELISCVEDGGDSDPDLASDALGWLHQLTGQEFRWDIDPAELRQWWGQYQSRFSPNVCYRMGRPIDLNDLADLLATAEARSRKWRLSELYIITGEDFGLDPFRPVGEQTEVAARARDWLREQAGSYERGAVYKYGHRQNLEHIFEPPSARSK